MVNIFGERIATSGQIGPRGPRGPRGRDGTSIDPTSTYEAYVKYINLRRKTIHSILGLVNITSNLGIYKGYLQTVLESSTTNCSFFWNNQAFQDKYIAFEFQKPVWLNQIQFVTHDHNTWTLHFTWQYSDDGKIWKQIGNEYNKEFISSVHPPVNLPLEMFTFPQETPKLENTRHTHWRMHGLGGNITTSPYINAVFIDLAI